MQSLHCQTLRLTVKINGDSAHCKAAATDILQRVESIHQIFGNLREKERRISGSKARQYTQRSVFFILTQKYLREEIDLPGVHKASGPYFTRLAQFKRMVMGNGMADSDGLDDALEVYEPFHVLKALPSRLSAQNLFKCNCCTCLQNELCPALGILPR